MRNSGERAKIYRYEKAGHVFAGNSYLGIPYGVLALGCSKKTNKIAAGDDQKVLQGCLAKWHTQ